MYTSWHIEKLKNIISSALKSSSDGEQKGHWSLIRSNIWELYSGTCGPIDIIKYQKKNKSADESTYQILSYGLLFSTFYCFLYTADPPTSTTPMWPTAIFVQTFAHPPLTIPYTHCTIGLVPHWRPSIWPMDYIVTFSFLSLFSFTWRILSWPDRSQVVALCDWDLTICFATQEPCACFTYRLYLRLLYLLQKKGSFPQNSDLSSSCLIILLCSVFTPSLYLVLPTHFALSHHTEPPSCWNGISGDVIPTWNWTFRLGIVSDHCAVNANDIILTADW